MHLKRWRRLSPVSCNKVGPDVEPTALSLGSVPRVKHLPCPFTLRMNMAGDRLHVNEHSWITNGCFRESHRDLIRFQKIVILSSQWALSVPEDWARLFPVSVLSQAPNTCSRETDFLLNVKSELGVSLSLLFFHSSFPLKNQWRINGSATLSVYMILEDWLSYSF